MEVTRASIPSCGRHSGVLHEMAALAYTSRIKPDRMRWAMGRIATAEHTYRCKKANK